MPIVIVLLGIILLFFLIVKCKLNAFITFILVSLLVGIAEGMTLKAVVESIQNGIGSTLGFLVMILGLGAMLGKLVADSGAAQRITSSLVSRFGIKNIQWAVVLTGFIVGIPMFYSVGFVILVPLVFTVGAATGLPLLYVGMPMLASLSVTHGYLPPHPAPTAITVMFEASLGKTLLYGIIIAIPAIIVAGPLFSRTIKNIRATPFKGVYQPKNSGISRNAGTRGQHPDSPASHCPYCRSYPGRFISPKGFVVSQGNRIFGRPCNSHAHCGPGSNIYPGAAEGETHG